MAIIAIQGSGSDIEYVPLAQEDFERLTQEGVETDDIEDYLSMGNNEGGPINSACELVVDGNSVRNIDLPLGDSKIYELTAPAPTPDYVLLKVISGVGDWKYAEIDDFEESKLDISPWLIALPGGIVVQFIQVYYDGDDIECGYTDTSSVDIFILDSKGVRHEIKMAE